MGHGASIASNAGTPNPRRVGVLPMVEQGPQLLRGGASRAREELDQWGARRLSVVSRRGPMHWANQPDRTSTATRVVRF